MLWNGGQSEGRWLLRGKCCSGSAEAIDATAEAFNAFYSRVGMDAGHYLMNHPGLVYLYDQQGRPVAALDEHASPEDIVRAVRARL